MVRSLWQLYLMHLREFFRDWEIILWSVLLPVAMSWVLGVAFVQRKVTTRQIAVVGDIKKSSELREVINEIENRNISRPKKPNDHSVFKFAFVDQQKAMTMLRKGKIVLYIQLTSNGTLHFHLDPANETSYLSYLILSRRLSQEKVALQLNPVTTHGNRYIDFLIPGLMALGIMNSCLWGIGYVLIEYRMKKLMRRMIATPVKKAVILASFFFSRMTINLVEVGLLFLFGYWYFGFVLQGSVANIMALFISGNVAFAGFAFLLASRAENTRTGNGIINAFSVPMMLASGIFFSYANFPEFIQPLLQYSPLALMADAMRTVFNTAGDFSEIFMPIVVLNIFGVFCFSLSLKIFRWH
ncbi:MAG: ABC transporter permease [Leptospiraceae bacterium]|nr:ABC transporter permease [Leptospiraceae bacterium]